MSFQGRITLISVSCMKLTYFDWFFKTKTSFQNRFSSRFHSLSCGSQSVEIFTNGALWFKFPISITFFPRNPYECTLSLGLDLLYMFYFFPTPQPVTTFSFWIWMKKAHHWRALWTHGEQKNKDASSENKSHHCDAFHHQLFVNFISQSLVAFKCQP